LRGLLIAANEKAIIIPTWQGLSVTSSPWPFKVRKEDKVQTRRSSIILSEAIEVLWKRMLDEVHVEVIASSDSGYGVGRYLQ
jgi:hypothetical protein